jgi:ParB-like chromosome segregation protein Spo0J
MMKEVRTMMEAADNREAYSSVGQVWKFRLDEIEVDPDISIRSLDHSTIARYVDDFEYLPPPVAFNVAGNLLLSDGFHRYSAAVRQGITEMAVEVREGTRNDALEHAILANVRHGKALSDSERDTAIMRLRDLRPKWPLRRLADAVGVSHVTVKRVLDASEVSQETDPDVVTAVTRRHLSVARRARPEQRAPLLRAAARRSWSAEELGYAVRELKDSRLPAEEKQTLLSGKRDPLPDPRAQKAFPVEVKVRRGEATAADFLCYGLDLLSRAELFNYQKEQLDPSQIDKVIGRAQRSLEFLRRVLIDLGAEVTT